MSLTKEQRLAVIDELWGHAYEGSYGDGFRAMYSFERKVKGGGKS